MMNAKNLVFILSVMIISYKTLLGRTFDQAAEVTLLSRNVVLDGSPGGAESKVGARVLITRFQEEIEGIYFQISKLCTKY